jgi:poly [ADP-ribose] polymerase
LAASNRFYTLIPHDCGQNTPPIIKTSQMVQDRMRVVETLLELEIATTLMKLDSGAEDHDPMYAHYRKLKTDITPVDSSTPEWDLIQNYMTTTHGVTHTRFTLSLVHAYKVERESESDRFQPFCRNKNRLLLWHGSRTTNFVGILSQGLRIAPPEAPVTGYMFGKGVYFAQCVSKSASYTATTKQDNLGYMLLCEVALDDMYETKHAEYMDTPRPHTLSTKGCGCHHENGKAPMHTLPDGCRVPLGPMVAEDSRRYGSSLLYDEYIVYNVAQIRVRYLVKVKFDYAY